MNVKCELCKTKGYHSTDNLSEFHASRFLWVHNLKTNKIIPNFLNTCFICRKCLSKILDSLQYEQNRINDLYKPQIEEKKVKQNKN